MPAALAAITVLRPGSDGQERDFELRVVAIDEDVPKAAAYIAAGSMNDLVDIVLALTEVVNAPRVD